MSESFSKKENQKKRAKKKQDKAQKIEERKTNNNKGKAMEDMMAYIDENGNLTSTPPDTRNRKEINPDDIRLGAAAIIEEDPQRSGFVAVYNEAKGFGFITDEETREDLFFHSSQLAQPVKQRDRVTFEKEKTARGFSAVRINKVSK